MISIESPQIANFIGKRRWLRRLDLFRLPATSFVTWHGLKIHVDLTDLRGPSFYILKEGVDRYEPENFEVFKKFLPQSQVLLDVGANIGLFTFKSLAFKPNLAVHCFEPDALAYNCLQQTVASNQCQTVRLHNVGISDHAGKASFYIDQDNRGGHSLDPNAILGEGGRVSHQSQITLETVDRMVERFQLSRVDLIKIDVQRLEDKVLAGGINSLRRFRPVVLIECFIEHLNLPSSGLLSPFQSCGDYLIYEPTANQWIEVENYTPDFLKHFTTMYCDLFFVPKARRSEIS